MSSVVDNVQKLQQDLQNELTTTNQLLVLISEELQKLKNFTNAGSEFHSTIKQNANLMASLANMQKIDIMNLKPVPKSNITPQTNQNRNDMDDSS